MPVDILWQRNRLLISYVCKQGVLSVLAFEYEMIIGTPIENRAAIPVGCVTILVGYGNGGKGNASMIIAAKGQGQIAPIVDGKQIPALVKGVASDLDQILSECHFNQVLTVSECVSFDFRNAIGNDKAHQRGAAVKRAIRNTGDPRRKGHAQ